jgi:hypothetical protein
MENPFILEKVYEVDTMCVMYGNPEVLEVAFTFTVIPCTSSLGIRFYVTDGKEGVGRSA